ncbi:hypothetical protein LSAT2_003164, partial [Lamellibrachia satsuma]
EIMPMFNESSKNTLNVTSQLLLTDGVSGSVMAMVVSYLMLYGTPAIILVGLIGNTLSLVVYSCTHLERASYSLYMCMLSVANICFIGALSLVWLDRVGVKFFTSFGWCQVSTQTQATHSDTSFHFSPFYEFHATLESSETITHLI